MGLNAVVYVHRDNLALDQENGPIKTDEETGEVYLEGLELVEQYPKSMFVAANKRLGNIDAIATIRDEIIKVIGVNSILHSKILYSGSHSGDVISLECLDELESELNLTKEATANGRSSTLESFLRDMSELLEAARKQKNPIVFV